MQQNRNPLCIYDTWLAKVKDPLLRRELLFMWDQKDRIRDAFRLSLSFGTGGLRGVMGAGTDRLNIYTVRRATRGLAAYLLAHGGRCVAIGYDTRQNSRLFSETAANTLAACGLSVFLFDKSLPTPMLSYAVRALS